MKKRDQLKLRSRATACEPRTLTERKARLSNWPDKGSGDVMIQINAINRDFARGKGSR